MLNRKLDAYNLLRKNICILFFSRQRGTKSNLSGSANRFKPSPKSRGVSNYSRLSGMWLKVKWFGIIDVDEEVFEGEIMKVGV